MKIIGSNRREGIDYIQDQLGPHCPRTTAEATFFGLVREGRVVGCKNALILTESPSTEELRDIAHRELKGKIKRRVGTRSPRGDMKSIKHRADHKHVHKKKDQQKQKHDQAKTDSAIDSGDIKIGTYEDDD